MDGANQAAANVCFNTQYPCGNTVRGKPSAAYFRGQNAFVSVSYTYVYTFTSLPAVCHSTILQILKNLDHYNPAAPGNFSAYLIASDNSRYLLGTLPDTSAPSLTVYQMEVSILSSLAAGNYTLQSVYITDNTAAPAAFYQCADVQLL